MAGAPTSAKLTLWGGAIGAAAVALLAAAALLRWNSDGAEAGCAESGGVWDFEAQTCASPHGPGDAPAATR